MSDAITQCPACQTSFRVTPLQLDVADGSVRCGACLNIFQAEDHFLSPPIGLPEQALIEQRYWDDFSEYVSQTGQRVSTNPPPGSFDELLNKDLEAHYDADDADDGSDPAQYDVEVVSASALAPEASVSVEVSKAVPISSEASVSNDRGPDDNRPADSSFVEHLIALPNVVESTAPLIVVPQELVPQIERPQIFVPSDAAIAAAKRSLAGEDVGVVGFWDPLDALGQISAGVPSLSSPRKHLVGLSEPQTSDSSASQVLSKRIEISSNEPVSESMDIAGDVNAEFLEFVWFHSGTQLFIASPEESKRNSPVDAEENYDEYLQFVGPSGEVKNADGNASVEVLDSTELGGKSGASYLSELRDSEDSDALGINPGAERDEAVFRLDVAEDMVLADFNRRHRRLELKWLPGIVLLLLVSFTQYAYFNMDRYAQVPEYRGWYENVCRLLPCKLPTYRNYSQLVTKDLVIRSHPDQDNGLLLDVLLLNAADDRQEFPRLRLNFFDINGGVVATRDFEVKEYLGGELRGLRFIPAVTEVRLSLALKDPGRDALGYEMVVLAH